MYGPLEITLLVLLWVFVIYVVVGAVKGKKAERERKKLLLATGVASVATIVSMKQRGGINTASTGVWIDFKLNVKKVEGGTVEASIKEYMPMVKLGRFTEGDELPVRYDASTPSNPVLVVAEI